MSIIRRIKQTMSRWSSLTSDNDTIIFDFGDVEITKRELIASISIVAIMLIIGITISGCITAKIEDNKKMYNQALKVEDADMFRYGMETNVGNALVYGTLAAVDTVNYEDVGGSYLWIRRDLEIYTRHTREVTHTDADGNTYTTTEVYYTWDLEKREEKHAEKITFLGQEFDYSKIGVSYHHYIDTIYEDYDTRYVYYGSDPEHTGTIFTKLQDNTIESCNLKEDKTIDDVIEAENSDSPIYIFWIAWIMVTILVVGAFYYADNRWLD